MHDTFHYSVCIATLFPSVLHSDLMILNDSILSWKAINILHHKPILAEPHCAQIWISSQPIWCDCTESHCFIVLYCFIVAAVAFQTSTCLSQQNQLAPLEIALPLVCSRLAKAQHLAWLTIIPSTSEWVAYSIYWPAYPNQKQVVVHKNGQFYCLFCLDGRFLLESTKKAERDVE